MVGMLAYVDPGSGHLVLQLLLGALAGTLFHLKKIRAMGARLLHRQDSQFPDAEQ